MGEGWRERLYGAYVSSGQAGPGAEGDPEAALAARRPYIRAVARRHLPEDRSVPILDLGCGHGAWLVVLKEMGYRNLAGVDASAEQVALARDLGVSEVREGDALEAARAAEAESVGAVLLIDLLEHLAGEALLALVEETRRILRPGGLCLAHVPNAEGLFGMRVRYGDLTHARAFTPRSAGQLFRAAGFREVACHEDRPVVHGAASLLRRLLWTAGTALPRLLLLAETGERGAVLSQNMVVAARR